MMLKKSDIYKERERHLLRSSLEKVEPIALQERSKQAQTFSSQYPYYENGNISKNILWLLKKFYIFYFIIKISKSAAQTCKAQVQIYGKEVLQNSGHGINQIGNYYDCIEAPGFNYNMVWLAMNGVNFKTFTGLCLPSSCTPQTIKLTLDELFLQIGSPLSVQTVNNHVEEYSFPFRWNFYLTVIILIILLCLVIYSTVQGSTHRLLRGLTLQKSIDSFNIKQSDLNILNGVRALAMIWVIIGLYYFSSIKYISNAISINQILKRTWVLLIEGGLTAVDIFFFLEGFFLAFVFMKQKSNIKMKYFYSIVHRILKIRPVYAVAMMIYFCIYLHLGSGPLWGQQQQKVMVCTHMSHDVLFLNNFIDNGQNMCIDWGWYLQADFQIYVVCIIILVIYERFDRVASYLLTVILVLGSIALNIIYTQQNNVKLLTNISASANYYNYFLDIYIKPYTRWTSYFMGFYLGIFYDQYKKSSQDASLKDIFSVKVMHSIKQSFDNNKYMRMAVEWFGIALMTFVIFIPRTLQKGQEWQQMWHSLYECLSGPFFVVGLIMLTFPTIWGCKGSIFRLLLDNKLLNFIAKISFCTYLVGQMVILQFISSRKYDNYLSFYATLPICLSLLVVSCFFGLFMKLFVEAPFSAWVQEFMKKFRNCCSGQEVNQHEENFKDGQRNQTIENEAKTLKNQ